MPAVVQKTSKWVSFTASGVRSDSAARWQARHSIRSGWVGNKGDGLTGVKCTVCQDVVIFVFKD